MTGSFAIICLAGKKAFEPGLLAKANRGILYVDEVSKTDGTMPGDCVDPEMLPKGAGLLQRLLKELTCAPLISCVLMIISCKGVDWCIQPQVNLLDDHLVDVLLDSAASGWNTVEREGISISHPARFILVGSGNPEEGELRPQLLDRFGMHAQVGKGVLNITRRELSVKHVTGTAHRRYDMILGTLLLWQSHVFAMPHCCRSAPCVSPSCVSRL